MKKYITITLLFFASLSIAIAQKISTQTFVQQTVMGLQKGYGLRAQTNKGWGVGVLFQSNGKLSLENSEGNYPFIGLETLIPLTKCGNVSFFLTPKVGFVNTNYFVIIPEVETSIKINKRFSTAITAGMRSRESSVGAKLIINLK